MYKVERKGIGALYFVGNSYPAGASPPQVGWETKGCLQTPLRIRVKGVHSCRRNRLPGTVRVGTVYVLRWTRSKNMTLIT